jgi:tetratricopeptide (TPR) repeat protein
MHGARTALCIGYILLCVLSARTERRLTTLGLVGFCIWLLPAANLVPLYFPLQDRYASLPLFSLGVALAGLALQPQGRGHTAARGVRGLRFLGYVAVLALGLRTLQYEGVWQSELRLWGHAVHAQPDSDYAFLKLGEVRREAGDLEGAIAAYHGAIRVAPLRKLAHAGLFEVVARRDERLHQMPVSRARQLAQQYYQSMSNAEALRGLPAQLWSMGYLRTAELPLQALYAIEQVPQSVVLQSAQAALRAGRVGLARFYVHELAEPPKSGPLAELYSEPYFRVAP